MPSYTLEHKETGERKDVVCSIAEMTRLTDKETGEYKNIIGAPMLVTHVGSVAGKTSGDWKDLLKKIKKGSAKDSTINW